MCMATVKQKTKDIIFSIILKNPSRITYNVTKKKFINENTIEYIGYGIRASISGVAMDEIEDISTDYKDVKTLVEKCNHYSLAIKHFRDVVEDFILR